MKDCRLGVYEKAMPSDLTWAERLRAVRETGFDFLEISIDETDERLSRLCWADSQRAEILDAIRGESVPISTMCLSGHRKYPLGSHDAAIRSMGREIFTKAVCLACDLGVRLIQLAGYDVYYELGDDATRAFFFENIHYCVEYAAQYGVNLGFETMETPFMDTVVKGMEYVRAVESPHLGMYPDLGNLTNAAQLYGLDLRREIRSGVGHTFAMHLKETMPGKYRDMRFGAGKVDFARGIAYARKIGVRLFVAEFWHDGSKDWMHTLSESNHFLTLQFAMAMDNALLDTSGGKTV